MHTAPVLILVSMSRRIVALVTGASLVFVLASGLRADLIPGAGNPRSQCCVGFDVHAETDPSNHVACTDGDPCDSDGKCDGVCTFRVRVCVNERNMPECTPTPFEKPARGSVPLEAPTVTNGDSACGAFTD